MTKRLLALATMIMFANYHSQAQTNQTQTDKLAKEVLQVVAEYHKAGVEGDLQHFRQLFDEGVTHFHPGSPYRFAGRDAVTRDYQDFIEQTENLHVEMIDPKVQLVGGNVAVVTYYMTETWQERGKGKGNFKTTTEKSTEVYVKKDDGKWYQVHTHYSTN